jgi:hypothetical protein
MFKESKFLDWLQGAMKPKELMKEKKRFKVKRSSDEAHWKFSKKADMECK